MDNDIEQYLRSAFVIWIDEETNLIKGEILDLELRGYETKHFSGAGKALDAFAAEPRLITNARAILIDLLMPTAGDARFASTDGAPVGVRLCMQLEGSLLWASFSQKAIIYTRSCESESYVRAQAYARERNIHFMHKGAGVLIARELIDEGRIK